MTNEIALCKTASSIQKENFLKRLGHSLKNA